MTGDEPGSCQAVTGTPYAGLEQAGQHCGTPAVQAIRERTPVRPGTPSAAMTGIQPGVGGVMTGDKRGACEAVTGTPMWVLISSQLPAALMPLLAPTPTVSPLRVLPGPASAWCLLPVQPSSSVRPAPV